MATFDATQALARLDGYLKEVYTDYRNVLLAVDKRPLLAWINKKEDFYGDALPIPLDLADPSNVSSTFSTAMSNAGVSENTKWVLTERKKAYNAIKLDAEAMAASSKDMGSFLEHRGREVKGMLRAIGRKQHIDLYGNGAGYVATISSGGGTTSITLTVASDALRFQPGQLIRAGTIAGTTATPTGAAAVTVEGINADTGVITTSAALGAGAGTEYIWFTNAEYGNVSLTGLDAWLPLSAPGSTAFFGVDRTQNVTALSGHRVDQPQRSILENGQELAMKIGEVGGSPDVWVMNPRAGLQLASQLNVQVERIDGQTGKTKFGFRGFTLVGHMASEIDVMFDYACKPDRAYMLQRDTWAIHHLKGFPHIATDDGQSARQDDSTFDGIKIYCRSWGELACTAPLYNGVMSVAV